MSNSGPERVEAPPGPERVPQPARAPAPASPLGQLAGETGTDAVIALQRTAGNQATIRALHADVPHDDD